MSSFQEALDLQEWFTLRRQLAVRDAVGGQEVLEKILSGDYEIKLTKKILPLFDHNGRRIPRNLASKVCDPNKKFCLYQPQMVTQTNFAHRMLRLEKALGENIDITWESFEYQTNELLTFLPTIDGSFSLSHAVCLPIIIPRIKIKDVGTVIEQWLDGVDSSYMATFKARSFKNCLTDELRNRISFVPESRHDRLFEQIKERPIIGLYFPDTLQGFSTNAAREQMADLPKNFILSGLDAIIGMIMYPDILARDHQTPSIDMAAFSYNSAGFPLCFNLCGHQLDLCHHDHTDNDYAAHSGGLFFSHLA